MLNRYLSDTTDFLSYSKEELLVVIRDLQQALADSQSVDQSTISDKEDAPILASDAIHSCENISASPQKFRQDGLNYAVNQVDENIFAISSDGEFLFANQQFLKDHLQESVVGKSAVGVLFGCRNQSEWDQLRDNIRNSNGAYHYLVEKDDTRGKKFSYEVVVHHSFCTNGSEEFWFFARNVTERLEKDKMILDLNSLMDAILSNAPVYLFVKDSVDYRYLYWNKALEEQLGITSQYAVGKTDVEIFPDPQDAQKFHEDDLYLMQTRAKIEMVEELTDTKGVKRIVKTIKTLIDRQNESPLIIGVSLDITDLKQMEHQLIIAKQDAEQSNQLKSAFLANMSHEIRTPLNAIVGFAKLIMTEEDKESQKEYADIIDRNADLLLQLINDILDLSKIEAGTLDFNFKEFNLDELCNDMFEVHSMRVSDEVSLLYERNHTDLLVYSDRNRLAQVFTNLLSNAIKFTPRGEIRFGYLVANGQLEMFVSDTGMGISPEKLPNIFERFVKLNTFVNGTGLGLSITRTILDNLGGTISVTSEPHEGTKFVFSIPLTRQDLSSSTDDKMFDDIAEKPHIKPVATNKTILVVEDNDSNYKMIQRYLGDNYKHYRASNGCEAVEMYRKYKMGLILMDIKMPVMDGLQATKKIRELSQEVPIIAVTACAYDSDKDHFLDAGCNHFLPKPVSFDKLQSLLDHYLKG